MPPAPKASSGPGEAPAAGEGAVADPAARLRRTRCHTAPNSGGQASMPSRMIIGARSSGSDLSPV